VDLADSSLDRGGVWCPDGSIVYAPEATAGLMRLPAGGGAPQVLTRVDAAHGERTHRWPAVLPGGREVAFTIGRIGQPGSYDGSTIDAVDLASGKRRTLLRGASMVRFAANGMALLARDGQVLALPIAQLHGQNVEDAPVALRSVSGVPASGIAHFAVAEDGTLVYAELDPHANELELVWYDRAGAATPLPVPKGQYRVLRFSPDGKRVAMAVGAGGGREGDIWVLDPAAGTAAKLTFDGRSWAPVWSRDGKSITYTVMTVAGGGEDLRTRPADGSQIETTLAHFDEARARGPAGWAADGSLIYAEDDGANGAGNLYSLRPGEQPRPFVATPAVELQPAVSPDGRFVAYSADATGRADLYVQPFPPTGAKWLLAEGAGAPVWSLDGRELYFARGRELVAVSVTENPTFGVGPERKLFAVPVPAMIGDDQATAYAVAPDGRFLASRGTSTDVMNDHLVVVLNWLSRLRTIVSANR
jgi:serine/threonine-protein kinase